VSHKYSIRYLVQPWNKTIPQRDGAGKQVRPNVTVSNTDYGYTDRLFIISILDEGTEDESLLLLDSKDGPDMTREYLEKLRDAITHHIETHT
jgi:hypothetical protein